MSEFFFEILSEEIPARMQKRAEDDLRVLLEKELQARQLAFKTLETCSTPRRLIACVIGLPAQQQDISEEKKGPRIDAPPAAIEGFLKSCGLTDVSQCEQRDSGKGVFLYAKLESKGQPTSAILPDIITKILNEFSWPKSMRWSDRSDTWVRPLHQVMACWDGKVLPDFAASTAGHRFLAKNKITPGNFADYRQQLEENFVLVARSERSARIRQGADAVAKMEGLALAIDDALLEEITGLVEWPVILLGSFESDYLSVPKEVLITTMRVNQKYIPLLKADGTLAPCFIITSNMAAKDGGRQIIAGNERVLRARLSDAKFFYEQDLKTKLADRVDALKAITFHEKIGTMYDKVQRMASIAAELAPAVQADAERAKRAVLMSKADLTSGMVGEFPELQGIMGGYYAAQDREGDDIASAVRDHYLPLGPATPVPCSPVAVAVSLADKIDSLREFFRINEKPTGSRDPFALRRAALGIIRIILENNLVLDLMQFLDADVMVFVKDRLKVVLRDQDLKHDIIDAVLVDSDSGDLQKIVARVKAVQDFIATETGKALLAGYKRAANILAIEEKKDKVSYAGDIKDTFATPAEKSLYQSITEIGRHIDGKLAVNDFTGAMNNMAMLRSPVDVFFDHVLVNDPDMDIRRNRLQLLALLRNTMNQIANFSKIEG